MYVEILKHSLDRISSLEHYYIIEAENVSKVSYEGAKPHMLGAMIDNYLNTLLRSRKDELDSEQFKQIKEAALKHIKVIASSEQEDIKRIIYRFLSQEDMEKVGNVKEEKKLWDRYIDMPSIHGDSTLIMLITRFEEFVSDYLKALYIQFPQKYLDDQQLKFSEIASGDIEEIKKNLIFREVDAKMRESYKEWFKIYESHGMRCKSFDHDLLVLSEIYARRNVIVHNSGKVNLTYLNSVPKSTAKLGEKLFVDARYMKTAFVTIYRIIILMLIESSKLNKKNEEAYLKSIFNVLFDFLLLQRYEVCEPAYAELSKKNCVNAEVKLMSQFNRWICIIAEKGLHEVEEEIKAFDVSALSNIFKLAKDILLKEYDAANLRLKELLLNREITSKMIEEWPLFMWYRETEQFKKLKEDLPDKFGLEREESLEPDSIESNELINSDLLVNGCEKQQTLGEKNGKNR